MQIEEIIARFRNPDEAEQEIARQQLVQLQQVGLDSEQKTAILYALAEPFPRNKKRANGFYHLSSAVETLHPEHIPVLYQAFPAYEKNFKEGFLRRLLDIGTEEAMIAYTELVKKEAYRAEIISIVPYGFVRNPSYPNIIIPALINLVGIAKYRNDILNLLLSYFKHKIFYTPQIAFLLELLEDIYQAHFAYIHKNLQDHGVAGIWNDDYQAYQYTAGVILQLLGYIPSSQAIKMLQEAVCLKDPQLVLFAALSLLQQGQPVEPHIWQLIAHSPVTRTMLFDELLSIDEISLFPQEFYSQEAFAESDMVSFLIDIECFWRTPDEIELMNVITITTDKEEDILDCYIFRFRTDSPSWASNIGWMAGVSGPYPRRKTPLSFAAAFSDFNAWDSMTPSEHLGDIQLVLKKWHEQREFHGSA